jgi:hypothetical protein
MLNCSKEFPIFYVIKSAKTLDWSLFWAISRHTFSTFFFQFLGHYFMEPGDYHDAPIHQILHFI